jgi:lipopolysaccharide biosynthesis glycosyltransferase
VNDKPTPRPARWAIYCLGNDAVLDWLLALFESLREFGPRLPVRVIAYDDRQEALSREVARRGYSYFRHSEIEAMHGIGRRFYPHDDFAARGFRKLAAFSGPDDRFLVVDSDVVALTPLEELCMALEGDADITHFDTDPDQVYRPGSLRASLEANGGGRGFNAGLFAGRRGALDSSRLAATLADLGSDWRVHLVPNAEQPFLNLYAERAQLRLAYAHEALSDTCSTCWPATGRIELEADGWRLRGSGRWDEGRRVRLVHWAGFRLEPSMPNYSVWERYRSRARA